MTSPSLRKTLAGSVLGAGLLAFPACSSEDGTGDDGSAAGASDQWFTGVAAGESGSGSFTASVDIVRLASANADLRPAGAPGSDPAARDVVGTCHHADGTSDELIGTYAEDGSFTVTGGGYTFEGAFDGETMAGSVTGPDGAVGEFSGVDAAGQRAGRYCGSYEGSGSGAWNFVVAESGQLSGAFSGRAVGRLTGTVDGDGVAMTWSGRNPGGEHEPAGGTAEGAIADGVVTGTWKGTAGDFDVAGSWRSDASCPGPAGGPERTDSSCGNCSCMPINSCAPLPGGASICCYASTADG